MLNIRKLLWDKRNIFHIARHNIIPEDVEEVCKEKPVIQRETKRIESYFSVQPPTRDC
jgi:hypothetical protein